MRRIIAAIDDGAAARPVLAAAAAVAAVVGATAEVVHVHADAAGTIRTAAEVLGLRVGSIRHGPLSSIAEMARADDVVGVVVASHGGPRGERLAALVDGELLTSLDKPILVVPPEAQVMTRLRRVLVPMEGDPATAHALRTTIGLASASELEVVVLHVDDKASLPAFEDQPQYETEAWAAEFLARYVPIPAEAVRLELRVGVPAEQVLAVASEVGADLIALGWSQDLSPGREDRAAGDRAQPDPRAAPPDRRAPGPSGLTLCLLTSTVSQTSVFVHAVGPEMTAMGFRLWALGPSGHRLRAPA